MTTCTSLSFTNEEENLLITFIEKHPALWDTASADYGNTHLRQNCWQRLARQLHKSEHDCRCKWRFIRDYYLHKRKLAPAVAGADKTESKYQNLHFLRKNVKRRSQGTKNNTSKKIQQLREYLAVVCESDVDDSTVDINSQQAVEATLTTVLAETEDRLDDSTIDINSQQAVAETTFTSVSTNELESEENEVLVEHMLHTSEEELTCCSIDDAPSMDKLLKFAHDSNKAVKKDDFCSAAQQRAIDLFFQSMAATVKTFPAHMVAQAKLKVFNAINELEMHLNQSN